MWSTTESLESIVVEMAFPFLRLCEVVVHFVFILNLAAFQVNEQARRPIPEMPTGDIVFEPDKRVRRLGQIVQQDFDTGIGK